MKKIFLICPVRNMTPEEQVALEHYVQELENAHNQVYWPFRDTNQADAVGLRICEDNRHAIEEAGEIHIFWNEKSSGSLFDFGMAFALKKKIVLVNPKSIPETATKSFNNVLHALNAPPK